MGSAPASVARAGWSDALRAALFAFVLSRVLVVVTALAAVAYAQQWGPGANAAGTLRLATPQAIDALRARVLANDAHWYLTIAEGGYERRPFDTTRQANWAFFPLHPYLWRGVMWFGLDAAAAGLLLAQLFFLLALVQLHRWLQVAADAATADRGVMLVALFPTSYFFSLPWTESLYLFLTASALLAIARARDGAAAGWALLASATRPTGVLLAALLWWEARRDGRRWPPARVWWLAALATSGLLAFMAWLWHVTGNPLAFSEIQVAWGRDGGSLTKHLRRWLLDPLLVAEPWNVRWINNGALLLGLGAAVWLWRRGLRGLALFVFFSVAIPWSTGTLMSMARYVMACAPVFLAVASWTRRPRLGWAWIVASTASLVGMTAAFALGASFAGA